MRSWKFMALVVVVALGQAVAVSMTTITCHCLPTQSCWPSPQAWTQLNASLTGHLIPLLPVAAPCHEPYWDRATCDNIYSQRFDSAWLADQPGALQWENWQGWADREEECFMEVVHWVECGQGRIPLFAALVESTEDIQQVLNFTSVHNIKLVIRNTGHDFLGRSSGPHSLQLNTHKLTSITLDHSFVPRVPNGVAPPPGIQAVTFGAGIMMHEAYQFLSSKGLVIAGASSSTVGLVGGYLQGGGHSIMGHIAGMASDNVLEYTVVIANGSVVTANDYQNQALFWALRGGGGGTFGVVVNATVKTYPDFPVVYANISFELPTPSTAFWNAIEAVHRHILPLNDAGATGVYTITPQKELPGFVDIARFVFDIWFVNQSSVSYAQDTVMPVLDDIRSAIVDRTNFSILAIPTMTTMLNDRFPGADNDERFLYLGSQLLPRSFLQSPTAPANISKVYQQVTFRENDYLQGFMVAGGQVRTNEGKIDSALNPAWRSTGLHVVFTSVYYPRIAHESESTWDRQGQAATDVTQVNVPLLRSLVPNATAYLNEADPHQPDWQNVFWGANYARLYDIKQSVDPKNIFITRLGVGSENWDDNGACRTGPPQSR